ncbi:MAG: MBL fold metallo-hydrolase, partial [Clostridia bacterium]
MEYIVERFTSPGIAHQSYLLGSGTEAAVIDPRRDWWTYTARAAELGMHIRYVFETHRNEDLVTGSLDLIRETGARVFHGGALDFEFGETVHDGDEFTLGALKVRALATPGHTPESFSYAVIHSEEGEEAVAVFTGDALFVGEVGRTDFYPDRARELATALYRSIHEKILALGDGTILYPAHGAGSACGTSISERNDSTLGLERAQNPLLSLSEEEFVAHKLAEKLPIPHYFRLMEKYNLLGPPPMTSLRRPPALSPEAAREAMEEGAFVVDVRSPAAFGGAHIPDALSIWRDGVASFAGWMLPPGEAKILLVADEDEVLDDVVLSLVRLGYDDIVGYIDRGTEAWASAGFELESSGLITASRLREMMEEGEVEVLDVRRR